MFKTAWEPLFPDLAQMFEGNVERRQVLVDCFHKQEKFLDAKEVGKGGACACACALHHVCWFINYLMIPCIDNLAAGVARRSLSCGCMQNCIVCVLYATTNTHPISIARNMDV